jgi:RNA polymerase sigma-70 factor (ECF subfamily)
VSREGLLAGSEILNERTETEERVTALVAAQFDFVWRLLRRFGMAPADADDATQQVFMIAARRLSNIVPGRERAFLYGTARRVLANMRRGSRRRRDTDDVDAMDEPATSAPRPDELVELGRARALLDELLASMPEDLRNVLVLAQVEGASVPEIAELEGIPVGTAASRLRRARESFRALLEKARDENPFEPERE